ncbi:MAG: hypothetical protein ACRDLK_01530 [Gaiellaceae bacterium]
MQTPAMRVAFLLALLAGLAALLATATGGGDLRSASFPPVGWTGYAPLGNAETIVCSTNGTPLGNKRRIIVFTWTRDSAGKPVIVSQGSPQIVCRVDTATTP